MKWYGNDDSSDDDASNDDVLNEDSSRNIYGTKNNQNTRDDNNNAKNDTNDNDDNTDQTTIYTSTYTLGSWMILVLSGQDNS